jgi:hypothetical protein
MELSEVDAAVSGTSRTADTAVTAGDTDAL